MLEEEFSSAHLIRGHRGECKRLHGHNYKVRVYIESSTLNKLGMVCDFKEIKKHLRNVISSFDHQELNKISPFDKINPTSEHIAFYIFESLKKELPGLYEVRVSEKDRRWVGYRK